MSETGIIFDLQKFAVQDGPGIRTTVFFKGCPLHCLWCHNPESKNPASEILQITNNCGSQKSDTVGYAISVDDLMYEISKDQIFYEESGGGITFSGGEPMMQTGFLHRLLLQCKKLNYHTAIDTSGYADWSDFEKINDLVDLYLYDLKLMDNSAHQEYTGESNRLILDNLHKLDNLSAHIILRIPLIPQITDTPDNLTAICEYAKSFKNIRKINLLPYNKLGEDKAQKYALDNKLGKLNVQSEEALQNMMAIFMDSGLEVRVAG